MIHVGKNTKQHDRLQGHLGRAKVRTRTAARSRSSSRRRDARNFSQCDSMLIGDQCGAHTFPYIDVQNPTAQMEHEASTSKIGEDQIFYCNQRGHRYRRRRLDDRQRLLQGGLQRATDGVRRRGAEASRGQSRGQRRLIPFRFVRDTVSGLSSDQTFEKTIPAGALRSRGDAEKVRFRDHVGDSRPAEASIEDQEILKGFDLKIGPGEVHAIMGPNGSGKSTLAQVLAGREEYEVSEGSVQFEGQDLLELDPEERAQKGLFLAFQYPVEIPGVISNTYFLKAAVNSVRKARGEAGRARRGRVSQAGPREGQSRRARRLAAQAPGERRLLRW